MLFRYLAAASPRPAPGASADALFVFAGHPARKEHGVALWRQGAADCLVLSVGRFEWRRYPALGVAGDEALRAAVERTPHRDRLFFVLLTRDARGVERVEVVPVGVRPFGTRNEARALASLARARGWRTVSVLSSGFHMRRVALAVGRAFQGSGIAITFAALPTDRDPHGAGRWWRRPRGVRLVVREAMKLFLYRFFLRP